MRKTLVVLLIFFICITFSQAALSADEVKPGDIVIVCNKSVPLKEINKSEVLEIFLGKTTTIGTQKVKIELATLREGPVHESFVKNYIKKTISQFKNFWKKRVFSGKAKMPKSFKTEKELVKYVSQTRGAIGYIAVKTSKDEKIITENVKVIAIKQQEESSNSSLNLFNTYKTDSQIAMSKWRDISNFSIYIRQPDDQANSYTRCIK